MAQIHKLTEMEQWKAIWDAAKAPDAAAVLIFKRSPICPTSHFVESEFNRFIGAQAESAKLRVYSVDVIGARQISQQIARDTGVTHESPQALLVTAGQKVAWHASHGDVDEEALEKHIVAL